MRYDGPLDYPSLIRADLLAAPPVAQPRPVLPVLLGLFVLSGCAALIYEIVWFQLLQLVIGSSAVSLGVLLGTYMGGMCLGSMALPRVVSRARHPLRVYAGLELGIAVFAILILVGFPYADRLYAAVAAHGLQGIFLRAAVAALCLLPPTLMMGASLPAVARFVETTPDGVSWLSLFYGGNIAGAVFGCLLAGFYLLRTYNMAAATFVAAAINIVVALISLALALRTDYSEPFDVPAREPALRAPGSAAVYISIGLSGMCALGAEVIWTRLLSVMLGATVYTFSIILAVFLVGLGIGTGIGSLLSRLSSPRTWLCLCQLLAALAIAWAAYTLAYSLPYWPIEPARSTRLWFTFQVDLMRCIWAILPAACVWGASFPLALAAVASKGQDSGRMVGEVYAANTVGAIAGAVGFSVLFVPWIGTQNSQRLLIALSAIAAFAVLMRLRRPSLTGALSVAAAACLVTVLVRGVGEIPWTAIAYGRRMLTTLYPGQLLYRGEGMNSSIVISQLDAGQIYFHVSGKVEASTEPFDMRLQRMLAHIPALVHNQPRSILVVGFGAGVTAGTFLVHPEIERIVICEIEKLIPPAASRYFAEQNHNVLRDRRTKVVYDDGRHYILTTPDKFDIITADPIHPWVKGTAALYSKEYFELVKRHLNPGGVIAQWVPLYESDPNTVKSELATFFEVFPGGMIWSNDNNGEGYDTVLLGQVEPTKIDVDRMQQRLDNQASVARSLREVGLPSGVDLLATYGGRAADLRPWLEHAHVNRDLDLRLQYLAGMGLNFNNAPVIGSQIRTYRRFPSDLFVGSPERLQALKTALRL